MLFHSKKSLIYTKYAKYSPPSKYNQQNKMAAFPHYCRLIESEFIPISDVEMSEVPDGVKMQFFFENFKLALKK